MYIICIEIKKTKNDCIQKHRFRQYTKKEKKEKKKRMENKYFWRCVLVL